MKPLLEARDLTAIFMWLVRDRYVVVCRACGCGSKHSTYAEACAAEKGHVCDEDFMEAKRVMATGDPEQIEAFLGRSRSARAGVAADAARSQPVRFMDFENGRGDQP